MYKEDINDIAEYLSLPKLTGLYQYHPWEAYAAYAGHGLGLCEHLKNEDRCKDDGKKLPTHETLLVEYTDQAILLHTLRLRTAVNVDFGDADPHAMASFELGANSRVDNIRRVWRLRYQFFGPWYGSLVFPKEVLIIMTGTRDEAIEEAIREAVGISVPKTPILTSKSEFIASRGSAELSWRMAIMELGR